VTSVAFGLFTLALLIPAVVLHELAHGYVSLRHGDPIGAYFRHTVDPIFNLLVPRV
jgi:hypothetical protein